MPTDKVVQNPVRNVLEISGKAKGSVVTAGNVGKQVLMLFVCYSFLKTKLLSNLDI